MHRLRTTTTVAALVGFEAGAIVLLHRLGRLSWMTIPWHSLRTWLDIAPIEDVVAASLRSIALTVAYWIAASTAAYAAARITRIPRLIAATAWATLPPIRRAIDRAIAVTVTTAALAAPLTPAMANEPPTTEPVIFQISDQGIPTPVNPPLVDPSQIIPPGVSDAGYTPNPAGGIVVGTEAGAGSDPTTYEVARDDNLWVISARHLRTTFPDRDVATEEISRYWRQVIETNTPTLRSGDPNLIFPGEQIVLPPTAPIVQGGDT